MNIFNSLGSNYDFGFVIKSLFGGFNDSAKEQLKRLLQNKYGGLPILVYKGREAITLALEILNLPKDSTVAINGFTCFAVYKAIENGGHIPELLDLDNSNTSFSLDLNFSASKLSKAVGQNPKIKAVIIQNTLGYPCDIEEIVKICRKNNLILIEDLAHCVGTRHLPANATHKALQAGKSGKEAGTVGDLVVLSFSQDKIIDAVSGGALIIRNKRYQNYFLASQGDALRSLRSKNISFKQQEVDRLYPLFTFIMRKTYPIGVGKLIHFILKRLNFLSKPMNESFYERYELPKLYISLVLDNFKNLSKNLGHRRTIASIYKETLSKSIASDFINKNINLSSNLRYPIFVENRTSLVEYLKKQGIYVSDIWYDSVDQSLTNAKNISDKILNLPTHKNISVKEAKILAGKINLWLKLK